LRARRAARRAVRRGAGHRGVRGRADHPHVRRVVAHAAPRADRGAPGCSPLLPPEMLATLALTSVAFGLLYLVLMIVRVRLERLKDEVRYLQQALSLRGE